MSSPGECSPDAARLPADERGQAQAYGTCVKQALPEVQKAACEREFAALRTCFFAAVRVALHWVCQSHAHDDAGEGDAAPGLKAAGRHCALRLLRVAREALPVECNFAVLAGARTLACAGRRAVGVLRGALRSDTTSAGVCCREERCKIVFLFGHPAQQLRHGRWRLQQGRREEEGESGLVRPEVGRLRQRGGC